MLSIHGIGHFHPENVLDNAFFESLDLGTTDEWIVSRVGIRTRRTVLPLDYIRETRNRDLRAAQEARLYSNAETGRRAALMAIERAGLCVEDIGMVIAGGCSPDTCTPAEASNIACALELEVPAIDVSAACSSFGAQLHFASAMQSALPDYTLLVVPENMTRVIDFTDRSTSILFGDGTAAAVVSTRHPGRLRVVSSMFGSSPKGADQVFIPRTGVFRQNGSAVQKFAIRRMGELLGAIQNELEPARRERLVYVGHQANLTMLESVCRRAGIERERHLHNIVDYGNQSAAGAPTVLSQNWAALGEHRDIALVVVGAGLSWAAIRLEIAEE